MKKSGKVLLAILAAVAIAGASFIGAVLFLNGQYGAALTEMDDSAVKSKTAEIQALIERYFVDDYDEQLLADGAAAGMVEATGDEWSYYLAADAVGDYEEQMSNAYVGVGITIVVDEQAGGMRVEEVTPGGPAAEGGVRAGDVMLAVEGQETLALGLSGTRELVRGEEGAEVTLTFRRGEERFDVTLTRRSIETEVVRCEMVDGTIGYITILNFDERCAEETIAGIEAMLEEGAQALLFDVRYNPGGYADELVTLLDYLLPEGELFRTVDYDGNEEVDRSDARCLRMPMAVLVNEESYSAAEFFAAALQEYDWAEIVGTQTYGKGNFQSAFMLSDGSMVNLSIGKYYTPSGKSLTETGVTPDAVVELDEEAEVRLYYGMLEMADDAQFQAAIALLNQKIS